MIVLFTFLVITNVLWFFLQYRALVSWRADIMQYETALRSKNESIKTRDGILAICQRETTQFKAQLITSIGEIIENKDNDSYDLIKSLEKLKLLVIEEELFQ